jgi:Fe2+ or Zn2+ uptake regulation protein
MNSQLVESLFQVIQTLPDEEKQALTRKLNASNQRRAILEKVKHRNAPPSNPVEILHQVRQERDQQLDDALQN